MYLSVWNLISGFLSGFIYESPDLYKFLDDARGNLTPEEALKIALPMAIESGWVYETETATTGNEPPSLALDNKTNRVIWLIYFSILKIKGEETSDSMDRTVGRIIVDDATGEVLEVRK